MTEIETQMDVIKTAIMTQVKSNVEQQHIHMYMIQTQFNANMEMVVKLAQCQSIDNNVQGDTSIESVQSSKNFNLDQKKSIYCN